MTGIKILLVPIYFLFTCACYSQKNTGLVNKINTKTGLVIDGYLNESEWNNANISHIKINDNWVVTINYFQDKENLYVAFLNLKLNDSTEIYPEVLIDAKNEKSLKWDDNDWWFHTSYSNCESNGKFNDYSTCKKGQKDGWTANNFPLEINQAVEIEINKSLLNISKGGFIGIAFDVTDTNTKWYFYPSNATLESSHKWKTLKL